MTILDQLNRPPSEAWKPAPGDTLIGRVTELDTRVTVHGEYPLVVLETEDGRLVGVHGFHTVLKSELARRRPAIGDRIGIRFDGNPPGKDYKSYRVVVDHAQPRDTGPDWDRIGMETAAEGAGNGTTDDGWPADDAAPLTETASGEPPF